MCQDNSCEYKAERDECLRALIPIAVNLACLGPEGECLDAVDCEQCMICNARKIAFPIIKWIRRGYKSENNT